MMAERRMTGPECPGCGCADAARVRTERFGRDVERCRCRHCGRQWTARPAADPLVERRPPPLVRNRADVAPDPVVVEQEAREEARGATPIYVPAQVPRCPQCGAESRVYCTRRPVRHHRCTECRHRFKSVEG